ncbi:MAG: hypothetical protein IPO21_18040 [Bacteroidales bacterium]|nr:hypothetical protein [Bacteroidales bacterium]
MGCNRLTYSFNTSFFDYADVRSHYFSIPLNLSFFVSNHFQIDVGAEYNLLLAIKNTDRKFRPIDLGPLVRLGYNTGRFTFGVNYYAGFLPVCTVVEISRGSSGYSATNYDMFNQNVYFYIHCNLVKKRLVEQSQR